MTSEEQKIIDIKVKYEDAIYGIIRFQEKLNELEEYELYLLEQRKKKIEEEQAATRDAEYEAWQREHGTKKVAIDGRNGYATGRYQDEEDLYQFLHLP